MDYFAKYGLTECDDGSLLVEYELRETIYNKKRLLSYGCHAEVLEPESLREQLKAEIDLMAKRYGSSKGKK
jgi:predicted DNA-binding transcriptional regulator YafY